MSRDYVVDVLTRVRKGLPDFTSREPVPVRNPLLRQTEEAIDSVRELVAAARQAEAKLEYLLSHVPQRRDQNRELVRLRRALNACGAPR